MKKKEVNIEAQALGCKLGRAYQIMLMQLAQALKRADLDITTNEYLILRALFSKDGIQQCEIADMTGKDKAIVCRSVAAMEKKGLVITECVSHKCLKVYLTDKGKMMEPKIITVAKERHHALEEMTTPEGLEIFTLILENIIKSK